MRKPSSRLYDVFLCEYREQPSPVPRHYTTGYSVCTKIASLREEEVAVHIKAVDKERLPDEVVITDSSTINAILGSLRATLSVDESLAGLSTHAYIVFRRST